MKRILIICFLLSLISPSWADASTLRSKHASSGKFYLGAGAGELFVHGANDNYIGSGMGWPNDRYSVNSASDEAYFFLSAGYTWKRPNDWLPYYSLGLRYMYVPQTTVKGTVNQYSLPTFKNYNYQYNVKLQNVLGTLQLDVYRWQNFMPYLLVGAGVANYQTSGYSEQALSNVTPRVSPGFSNNSGNNFAYLLGLGIDYILRENIRINLEYNYGDYGTVKTGNGANTPTLTGMNYSNASLKNKITSNTVLLGVTFYIG